MVCSYSLMSIEVVDLVNGRWRWLLGAWSLAAGDDAMMMTGASPRVVMTGD